MAIKADDEAQEEPHTPRVACKDSVILAERLRGGIAALLLAVGISAASRGILKLSAVYQMHVGKWTPANYLALVIMSGIPLSLAVLVFLGKRFSVIAALIYALFFSLVWLTRACRCRTGFVK